MTPNDCGLSAATFEAWLADELDGEARRSVRDHLDDCESCRRLSMQRDPSRLFSRLAAPSIVPTVRPAEAAEFLAGVRSGIAIRKAESRAHSSRGAGAARWLRLAAAFGGVAIAGAAAWSLADRSTSVEPRVAVSELRRSIERVHPDLRPVSRVDSPALEGLDRLDARVYDLNPGLGEDEPHVVLIVDAGMDI